MSTSADRWAQRIERRKVIKAAMQLETNAIEQAITQVILDSGASKTFVNSRRGLQLTGRSDKVVITAGGTKLQATNIRLLSTRHSPRVPGPGRQ